MNFRALTGAAPLKQALRGQVQPAFQHFRALTGAAPLKHVEIIAGKALKHHFRALTGAAPLKLALFAIWALYSVISAP